MKNTLGHFACLSLVLTCSLFPYTNQKNSIDLPNGESTTIKTSIYVSDWSTVTWSNSHSTYGNQILEAPALSEATMEQSIVLRFAKWEATGDLFALPLALNEDAMITMMLQPGEIEMYYYSAIPLDAPQIQVQYIIINAEDFLKKETGKKDFLKQLHQEGVDIKNYKEVMAYLQHHLVD